MPASVLKLLPLTLVAFAALGNDLAPDVLLENGHFKRLRTVAEQKMKANPNDAAAQYYLARIKFEQGDLDAALPLAEKAAALDPKNADCRYIIAAIYGRKAEQASIFRQLGLAKRYRQEAEAAIAINPLHIDARMGLLQFHLRAPGIAGGDKKKADQYINEIMRIDASRGYLAQATKAIIEKQTGSLESLYVKAVEANPKNYVALISLANFYGGETQKKYDLAEKYLREAQQVEPDRIGAYSRLASLFAFQTRWQDLDSIIPQAEKAVHDNLAPYYSAGRTLTNNGKDNARAERYFQKYLSLEPEITFPTHAHARWQLGLLYEKMGRKPEAIRELETALRLKPDLEDAKKDLKRLK